MATQPCPESRYVAGLTYGGIGFVAFSFFDFGTDIAYVSTEMDSAESSGLKVAAVIFLALPFMLIWFWIYMAITGIPMIEWTRTSSLSMWADESPLCTGEDAVCSCSVCGTGYTCQRTDYNVGIPPTWYKDGKEAHECSACFAMTATLCDPVMSPSGVAVGVSEGLLELSKPVTESSLQVLGGSLEKMAAGAKDGVGCLVEVTGAGAEAWTELAEEGCTASFKVYDTDCAICTPCAVVLAGCIIVGGYAAIVCFGATAFTGLLAGLVAAGSTALGILTSLAAGALGLLASLALIVPIAVMAIGISLSLFGPIIFTLGLSTLSGAISGVELILLKLDLVTSDDCRPSGTKRDSSSKNECYDSTPFGCEWELSECNQKCLDSACCVDQGQRENTDSCISRCFNFVCAQKVKFADFKYAIPYCLFFIFKLFFLLIGIPMAAIIGAFAGFGVAVLIPVLWGMGIYFKLFLLPRVWEKLKTFTYWWVDFLDYPTLLGNNKMCNEMEEDSYYRKRMDLLFFNVWAQEEHPERAFPIFMMTEICLEAIPQMIIQTMNNNLPSGGWNGLAVASICVSIFVLVDAVWTLVVSPLLDPEKSKCCATTMVGGTDA